MSKLLLTTSLLFLSLMIWAQTEAIEEQAIATPVKKASFESRMAAGDYSSLGLSTMPGQQLMSPSVSSAFGNKTMTYEEVKGSPYLSSKPVEGILVMNDDKEITRVPIKIDLYTRTIVATNDEGKDIAIDPVMYKSVVIPHNDDILTLEKVHREVPDEFFVVLHEDKELTFFREDYATFREGADNGISSTDPRFTHRTKYWIQSRNSKTPTKIKLKKKDIMEAIPKRRANAINRFLKEYKLKIQSEADLIYAFLNTQDDTIKKL